MTRSSRARDFDLEITTIAGITSGIGLDSGTDSDLISEIDSAGFDSCFGSGLIGSEISGSVSSGIDSIIGSLGLLGISNGSLNGI